MPTCPQGHESEWTDFCSVCGAPLAGDGDSTGGAGSGTAGGAAASSSGSPSAGADAGSAGVGGPGSGGPACPHCGYPRDAADTFCESCGYDFTTGQLPAGPVVAPAAGPSPAPAAASPPPPSIPATPSPAPTPSPASASAPVPSSSPPPASSSAPPPARSPASAQPPPATPAPTSSAAPAASPAPGAPAADAGAGAGPAAATSAVDPGTGAGPAAATSAPSGATPGTGTWWAVVDVDRRYYDRFSAGGPVAFPADPPEPQSIPLLADTIAVGRRSRSRGTAPGSTCPGRRRIRRSPTPTPRWYARGTARTPWSTPAPRTAPASTTTRTRCR